MSAVHGKWAGKAQAYAETFAPLCAELVDPLLNVLAPAPGERLLDIGTGTGAVAAAALARGCLVVAGDPEPDMLAMAALTAPGAELILAGLPELTGIEAGFDLITANCVLNQLAQPEASLRRLAELLRPGGRLAISTWPARHPLQQLWDDVVRQADAQIPESARRTARTGGMERTLDGVTAAVQRAGLLIERAWLHDFTHVVDQERWWSGPTRGVAWIGQVYAAQLPPKAAAMDEAYGRLSASYRGADGLLHLPATAIMVVATRPS